MDFTKLQGAANDFVLIEASGLHQDWRRLAIAICNRHLGVGADSLLLLLPSDKADFRMRTFDADGSEAETCGNGIRCLARYVLERGKVNPGKNEITNEITIETDAAINRVRTEIQDGKIRKFWANIGKPRFKADEIPVVLGKGEGSIVDIIHLLSYKVTVNNIALNLNFVSMGNPHAVHFCEKPVAEFPLAEIGPRVEHLSIFPRRVNFEIARVIGKDCLEARVWERGVGETMACGSGAGAIMVASKVLDFTGRRADIQLPGGVLNAEWNDDGEVILGGPAEIVFEGKWPD
jgi:diaminopimelate epimerase